VVWPRQVARLIVKELTLLRRDRQSVILLFAMPAIFVLFLSLALADVYDAKVGSPIYVEFEQDDDGEYAQRVRSILAGRGLFRTLSPADRAAGVEAQAHVEIPAGFSEALAVFVDSEGEESFDGPALRWRADPTLDLIYRRWIEMTLSHATLEAILDSLIEEEEVYEASPDHDGRNRGFVNEILPDDELSVLPTPLQQTVPGWSLFAMFFIAVPMAGSHFAERDTGTLRRLLGTPVPRSAIVAGRLLPYLTINVLQFGAMLLIGLFVVPLFGDQSLQLGSRALNLIPVTIVAAWAATGYGLLISSVARTAQQASAFGSSSIIVMAVIGGVMVPQFVMPELMQRLAYVSPLYWGLQAYFDVFLREAPLIETLPKLAVLTGFGASCFAVAALRLRSSVQQ